MNNVKNECTLKIDGEEVGNVTIDELTSKEPIPENKSVIEIGYVGYTGSLSINSSFKKEILGMLMPNYSVELHEVVRNLYNLEGVELENYIVNVPQILADINVYAHKYNQIENHEQIVLGVDETNKLIIPMLISVEGYKYTPIIIPLSINEDTKETLFEKYGDKLTVKDVTDSLANDVQGIFETSLHIPSSHSLDPSEKRGKKGKTIRNWEKKCFWQKGR